MNDIYIYIYVGDGLLTLKIYARRLIEFGYEV
jgi:hypothetical protein